MGRDLRPMQILTIAILVIMIGNAVAATSDDVNSAWAFANLLFLVPLSSLLWLAIRRRR